MNHYSQVVELFHAATDDLDFNQAKEAAADLDLDDQLTLVPTIIFTGRRLGVYEVRQ